MPDYTWDESSRRFLGAKGRPVPRTQVRAALDSTFTALTADARRHGERLVAGEINTSEFDLQMQGLIKRGHVISGTVASGGKGRVRTAGDLGYIGSQIRGEYGFLREFVRQIEAGEVPLDGRIVARAEMYAQGSRGTYEGVLRRGDIRAGYKEERRIINSSIPCPECTSYAGRGWQPIGILPNIGDSCSCRSRCACSWERRGKDSPAREKKLEDTQDKERTNKERKDREDRERREREERDRKDRERREREERDRLEKERREREERDRKDRERREEKERKRLEEIQRLRREKEERERREREKAKPVPPPRPAKAPKAAKGPKDFGADQDGAKRWTRDRFEEWNRGLAPRDRATLDDYSGVTYRGTNNYLRGIYRPDDPDIRSEIDGRVRVLDATIARGSLAEPATLYRKTSLKAIGIPEGNAPKPGHTFGDDAYSSTSLNRTVVENFAGDVTLKINAPKGTNAAAVSLATGGYEQEILLKRGLTYKVRGVTTDPSGKSVVDVDIVPAPKVSAPPVSRPRPAPPPEPPKPPPAPPKPPPAPPLRARAFTRAGDNYSDASDGRDEANDWGKGHWKGWADSLTRAEEGAIFGYKTDGYTEINNHLRGTRPNRNIGGAIAELDAVIGRGVVPEPVTVYRGVRDRALLGLADPKEAVGTVVREKGYLSTTLDFSRARTFTRSTEDVQGKTAAMFEFVIPQGTRGSFLDSVPKLDEIGLQESEIMLGRGYGLRIIDAREVDGVPVFRAVLEPPDAD